MDMISAQEKVERQAVEWLLAVNSPAFTDWQGWEMWLSADPLHKATYWRLAEREAGLVEGLREDHPAPRTEASDQSRRLWRPRRIAGAGLAVGTAAAACVAALTLYHRPEASLVMVETIAGQQRSLRLADGTQLSMNGATRLRIDRANPRNVTLEQGQATFTVAHDPAHPFSVIVGDASIRDLGTVFDVTRTASDLRLSVAEGSVAYAGQGQDIRLQAGQGLSLTGGVAKVGAVDKAHVGGWRTGRLSYQDAPLQEVATDLGRSLGVDIELSPAARALRFTGSFSVRADTDAVRARLQPILAVRIEVRGSKWMIFPAHGAS
jgi:transmembrane sensor